MKVWILLSLLLISCIQNDAVNFRYSQAGPVIFKQLPISWGFACSFPEKDRKFVREGFEYWNVKIGNTVFREVEKCGVAALMSAPEPRVIITFVPEINEVDHHILATTELNVVNGIPISGVLRYYKTWELYRFENSLDSTSRHEAGHVLGFEHSETGRCLMYPTITMERQVRKAKELCDEEISTAKKFYGKKEQ